MENKIIKLPALKEESDEFGNDIYHERLRNQALKEAANKLREQGFDVLFTDN